MWTPEMFFNWMLNGEEDLRQEVIGRDTVINGAYKFIIDTVKAADTGMYETAVKCNDDNWVVVEEYAMPESAKVGHEKWIKECYTCPVILCSVHMTEAKIYLDKDF